MNYWESHTQVAVRFRRFDRKRYAAFRSMHKVINIGVVTASTLLFALPDTVEKLRGLGADISKVERMPAALEQAL